jgi:hypothetical protein
MNVHICDRQLLWCSFRSWECHLGCLIPCDTSSFIESVLILFVGQDSSVGIATVLWAGRSGDQILVGARFSAPVQAGPGAHTASFIMGTGSFLGVNWPGHSVYPPPPPPHTSSNEVEERVELYLYSPSESSWPVLGWTLLYFTFTSYLV